jgi:uncharacterized protein (TIGR04551 family)
MGSQLGLRRLVPWTLGALAPIAALAPATARAEQQDDASSYGETGNETQREDIEDEEEDGETDAKKKAKKEEPASLFSGIFADDWFDLASPGFELHGYLRTRAQLMHNFSLGRKDAPGFDSTVDDGYPPLWPQPPDNSYVDTNTDNDPETDNSANEHVVQLCGNGLNEPCQNDLQAGANLRLRLEPTIFVGDNLRVYSQIDMLDNIVLGSTPQGYANSPSADGGYSVAARGGYSPLGGFATTTWSPTSGVTTIGDAVLVKRVWGEYRSPVGTILFGRMPHHWGLGMVRNAGSDVDADWGDNVDRIQFRTGLPSWNLYVSAAWDFANEGPTSSVLHSDQGQTTDIAPNGRVDDCMTEDIEHLEDEIEGQRTCGHDGALHPLPFGAGLYEQGGQPYDVARLDDLDQWVFTLEYLPEEQVARHDLALGFPVVRAGAYFMYQSQDISVEATDDNGASLGNKSSDINDGYVRRNYEAVLGDLWMQLRYRKVRIEVEAALIYGTLENTLDSESDSDNLRDSQNDGWTLRQFGITTQTEYRALADRLRLGFGFGFASGDGDVAGLQPSASAQSGSRVDRQLTLDRTYSTFRFNPNYKVDLILFRSLLTRIQGSYYFRPSVEYDFFQDGCIADKDRGPCPGEATIDPLEAGGGQRAGAGLTFIWSRASEPIQAPGHEPDLGAEINFKIYYQLSPGPVRAGVEEMGGFYTSLEYGVLFPLPGLDYLPGQVSAYSVATGEVLEISPAQTARWFLGIMF